MEQNDYADISFILRSPLARKILVCLGNNDKPLNPKQISKLTNIAGSNVSTKLKGLRERKLDECVNPNDRKWRFYQLTVYGKKVLAESQIIKQ